MNSYEIVKAAIYHKNPSRLPVMFGAFGQNDCAGLPLKPAASFKPSVPSEDDWGCVWAHTNTKNMGQVKGHPLHSINDLDKSKKPDMDDDTHYVGVPAALDEFEKQGKYITTDIFMVLWERMHSLYGFERVLTDLLFDRPAMERLADHVLDVQLNYVRAVSRRFGRRVHAFTMTDDWGTQAAAFISFDLWMDFFFPRYKKLFNAMHAAGYDVWVHSCGKINEIIEGFIKAGVNVINLQQPRALGIKEIGDRYRGRICFQSLADIQATLPTGDKKAIDADVTALAQHWISPAGGFIFSDYGDDEAIGVRDLSVKRYMYDKFSEVSQRLYGEPLPEPLA